jgi:hypothetical protein
VTYAESLAAIGNTADAEVASLTAALTTARADLAREYEYNVVQDGKIAALEARIAELTAVTPPPPPVDPPPVTAGTLPYAPPTGYAGFVRYIIPTAGGTITIPSGTDALLFAPNTITGPITIKGGRHRVLIGARLGGRKTIPTGAYDSPNRGIRLSDGDDTGTDHIEGVYGEPGTYFSDFVQVAIRTNNNRVVQIQNCRNDGTTYGTQATVHADVIQCWGGPATLRVHNLTATRVGYQGFYMDAGDGRALPTQGAPWTFSRINLVGLPGVRYLYANRQPAFTRATATDVWISGSPYNNADSFGNAPAGVKVGTVADFVPASLWSTSYVSPGYV